MLYCRHLPQANSKPYNQHHHFCVFINRYNFMNYPEMVLFDSGYCTAAIIQLRILSTSFSLAVSGEVVLVHRTICVMTYLISSSLTVET
jgi:hypothetical protein